MIAADGIRMIICENLQLWDVVKTSADLKPEHRLVEDLGADSINLVEMLMYFEEYFDCEVVDADAEKLITVGDVIKYAEDRKLGN